MKKNQKGITLVALVITIIILLILAGISINQLAGSGLFEKAKKAEEESKKSQELENSILGDYANKIDGYVSGIGDIIADGSWTGKVNSPKLMKGMTGVYWDETGKEVTVTTDNQNKWYDYENQKWANAKTEDGSYWVWIPRYEYKITGTTIDVKFIETSKTTVDSEYTYIHPSFRDGRSNNYMNGEWDKEISGFWVAKYAAGFQANTTSETSATTVVNGNDEVVYSDKKYTSCNSSYTTNALSQTLTSSGYSTQKISYPVFKPLTYAYNVISTGDSYTIAQEIAKATNFYGLEASQTDSHMMKNSEWGAVAYLTQSKYGRNGTEVTINSKNLNNLNSKNIYAVTGYAEGTANGVSASSTNNKSGVFDLSGCVWERVSAYITNGNSNLSAYGSSYVAKTTADGNGYKTLSTKYATVYPYNTSSDSSSNNWSKYNSLKTSTYGYGDAVLETSTSGSGATSWNSDYSYFPGSGGPFFVRGGVFADVTSAGTFAFSNTLGYPDYNNGFRVVLVG